MIKEHIPFLLKKPWEIINLSIYFAFSDENGKYKKDIDEKFIKSSPYYVRDTFLMLASDWKKLNMRFRRVKQRFNLPLEKEIKWSYLWSLRKYQRDDRNIPENKPFYFLKDIDYKELINFVDLSLELLSDLNYFKIIITITSNRHCPGINENDIYKMHIQDNMQRIEMELQDQKDNLCVLFIDPISEKMNRFLRNAYFDMCQKGDFIQYYSHIKDSLNLEYSHHSVGIQFADYIAGSFGGFLKRYEKSKEIFNTRIMPYLRTGSNREILGFGIMEVPTNEEVRTYIKEKLNA